MKDLSPLLAQRRGPRAQARIEPGTYLVAGGHANHLATPHPLVSYATKMNYCFIYFQAVAYSGMN
jgi:hypothetical protein